MSKKVKYFWEKDITAAYSNQQRFNLLLLEPGEIYFEDFSVYYYSSQFKEDEAVKRRQKGRLKLCSKSVLFEPLEASAPILKFLFRDVIDIGKWSGSLLSRLEQIGDMINVEAKECITMHEGNVIAPYQHIKKRDRYLFSLNFVYLNTVLPQIQQLLRAHTLNPHEATSMISTIVASRQANNKFNTSWIEDLYEKIIHETAASKISPLVCNPGEVLLTSNQLYFQPFNNVENEPVLKIKLSNIKNIIKRRYLLRHVGIEIFENDNDRSSMYLVFDNHNQRDLFYDLIMSQSEVCLHEDEQENMTLKWQSGALSNFDYLIYLNSKADRSFNDLTQYPVFPWIIKDYTSTVLDLENPSTFRDLSKPIGALDEQRLKQLKDRLNGMPEPKFLYGSHYSSPGFILYYLVRVAPEYMLCLQNGKFDKADRLFNSIQSTWMNCCTGHSDYKELIPEFYESDGTFLLNANHLKLGTRQDGSRVNDVQLPPWAKSSQDFISLCRQALECDYVSQQIHEWIDLIFGYKQKGEEAWKADNVFYYLTYEGALDLDSVDNVNERKCYEAQILEFGQTPKQLFQKPHPKKQLGSSSSIIPDEKEILHEDLKQTIDDIPVLDLNCSFGRQLSIEIDSGRLEWGASLKERCSLKLHKEAVNGICINKDATKIYTVSQDCQLKIYSLENNEQLRSINLCNMALSCCCLTEDESHVLIGSWDNMVYVYSIEYSRVVDTLNTNNDAVSSVKLKDNKLISSGWGSAVNIWSKTCSNNKKISFELIDDLEHDAEITCCDFYKNNKTCSTMIVSGNKYGSIALWDAEMLSQTAEFHLHSAAVTEVLFSPDGDSILTCSVDHYIKLIDVESEDNIYTKYMQHPVRCAVWDGHIVICGLDNGSILIWDLVKELCLSELKFHQDPVTSLCIHEEKKVLISGSSTGQIVIASLL